MIFIQQNSEELKFWLEVLTASSAFFSALIAFLSIGIAIFTFREFRKQRESSYMPDLYLAFSNTMKARVCNFQTGIRDVQCLIYDDDLHGVISYGIWHSIENIGLGAAKEVTIIWQFNTAKACKIIASTANVHLKVSFGEHFLEIQNAEGKKLISTSLLSITDDPITYDFVLPRRDERFTKSPSIPQPILELYTLMFLVRYDIFNCKTMPDIYFENFPEFPTLSAIMTYSDIGGKSYSKKFSCELGMRLLDHLPEVLDLENQEHLDITLSVNINQIRK